jgi:hypothetical protein
MAYAFIFFATRSDMPLLSGSTIVRVMLSVALAASHAPAHSAVPDAAANAEEVMAKVESQAAAEHKNILLSFSASWCVNCRLFDKFVADPAIHPILDKVFVFADLDTGELATDTHHANLPGGEKLLASLGGKDNGYPYIAMLDAKGNPIVNCLRPVGNGRGENIGYPFVPNEVDWFMEMLKKAAPSLSAHDTATIRNWLTAHGKH